jgi:amino acid transporter
MAIGPIYSAAIFCALVAGVAGGVGPAVVAIATIGALALAWVVAGYARRFAGAGSVYEYIAGVFGRRAGAAASLGYGYALLFLGPTFLVPACLLFQTFAEQHLGFDPGWWAGGVGGLLIVSVMQWLGISLSVRAQLTLTAISAIPIALLVIVVIAKGGAHGNELSVFNPFNHTHGDVFTALLFAVTLFVGFECAAALGAETADPHRAIPRAVLGSVVMTAVLFLLVMYAGTIGFGPAKVAASWGPDPNGLATLAHRYVGSADATLIELAVLFDVIAAWMAFTNSFARLAYALARDGLMPAPLARTSSRGVPWVGNATWVVVALGMLFATAVAHVENRFTMLSILVLPGLLMVQAIYALLAVGGFKLLRPGWRWLIPVIAATTPVLGIYGTIHPFPTGPVRWGIWLTVAGVVLCVSWFAYLLLRRSSTFDAPQPAAALGTRVEGAGV